MKSSLLKTEQDRRTISPLPSAPSGTVQPNVSYWNPTGTWTTQHNGDSLPPGLIFVAPPPPQIGKVISAYSTERLGKSKNLTILRLRGVAIGALIGVAAAVILLLTVPLALGGKMLLPVLLFTILGAIGWYNGKSRQITSYVGEEGIAVFTYDTEKRAVSRTEVLVFANARCLRTSRTKHYNRSTYTDTTFSYIWTDSSGVTLFSVAGRYKSEKNTPEEGSPYYFGAAAEAAWSDYHLPLYQTRLQQGEQLLFPLTGQKVIRLSADEVELQLGKGAVLIPLAELETIAVSDGTLTIKRRDHRIGILGIGRSGIFEIPYADIANARLLVFLLRRLRKTSHIGMQPTYGER